MTQRQKKHLQQNLIGYSFILPSVIGFVLFMAYPLFYSLYISFMDWNMFGDSSLSEFIGFSNYLDIPSNIYFQTGIKNNFLLSVVVVPITLCIALVVANLLNMKIYARGLIRTMYFVPYVTTVTAAALVFSAVFHPTYGPVNSLLYSLGFETVPGWATSSDTALLTVGIFWVWKILGYCIIIYIAGLQGISQSYYEAASIDGANNVEQFFHITLPLVAPTTFFLVITLAIQSFQVFPEVNILTQGGPGYTTTTMVYHIYKSAFVDYKMGYAAAVSWVFFLIIASITGIQWFGKRFWNKN